MSGVRFHAGLHGWQKGRRLSRHAVVDVGSNTIHLLVGEVDGGEVLPVTGEKVSARLGAGVEKSGRIAEERLELAADAIGLFARISALNGVSEPVIPATSAVRDAENGPELTERVRELTGLKMRLISGRRRPRSGSGGGLGGRSLVGGPCAGRGPRRGGSAQLIVGEAQSGPLMQVSLPLGSNRTTERFVENDPAKKKELRALDEHVKEMMPGWGSLAEGLGRGGRRFGEGDAQDHARQPDGGAAGQARLGGVGPSLGGARARVWARPRAGAG